ncbi:hypothetical protein MDS_0533 [Ectopseudomonas mendocina NK-01]|nr:hypothetical protein MDS_0533 [Pseudomonas mendocina NK-01]
MVSFAGPENITVQSPRPAGRGLGRGGADTASHRPTAAIPRPLSRLSVTERRKRGDQHQKSLHNRRAS